MKTTYTVVKETSVAVTHRRGTAEFFGTKGLSNHMSFATEEEAVFASAIAERCEANGIGTGEFVSIYSCITRMIKDKSEWAM